MTKTLVITSGGFDPLHAGHISAFERMSRIGELCVILNSDAWLRKKKEKCFLDQFNRFRILKSNKFVANVTFQFDDDKNDVISTLAWLVDNKKYDRFVFAKSGDRTHENSPEYEWCLANDVEWLEVESDYPDLHSSRILSDWQNQIINRSWGAYFTTVPYEIDGLKFKPKVLQIQVGAELSYQKHEHRHELWFVFEGEGVARVEEGEENGYIHERYVNLQEEKQVIVKRGQKHSIKNTGTIPLTILEWQIGEEVSEADITRYPG